ncbi:MAG: hypothetical protein EOQ64_15925 [Mesorhizobium sp.]|uniref:hypothetical protein n=1 Tax=Mesorhizobium sp. TaxID=1871066 RepID=UPI000FE63514|nr:hypothetical protein [Mesorhizobium sp.]RWG55696.1 MAG: hypothetical protein EOQ64_15925 [Mesorhizobium sp.]RWH46826.1 MAG: hypothetical protein EOQ78_02145 [Mesorhizobium sp.]RWI25846.1 MAG: hypothetical protein EOQ94_09670 [Mesorhizobium sp.]
MNDKSDAPIDRKPEVVYGADAIARAIDESDIRAVYHALEHGHIPGAFKRGRTWGLSIPAWRRAVHGDAA